MKQAIFEQFGQPAQVVRLVDRPIPVVQAGQVRVRLHASPINPADFLLITGQHAYRPALPASVGIEGAGTIDAVGPDVAGLSIGDRVAVVRGTNWCEYTVCHATDVIKLPTEIDMLQAAMLSVNPLTAFCLVTQQVPLKAGDWLIQNAANSAVGKLVIRLAAARGIRTINLVRRAELQAELTTLGADVVLVGEDNLAARVAAATAGAPVHLAIDAIAGESSLRLAEALASDSTLIVYGLLSGKPIQLPTARIVFDNITVKGFGRLRTLGAIGYSAAVAAYAELAGLIMSGQLASEIEATYPLSHIDQALRHAEQPGRSGKVLLVME